jgi:hypothetical protein
MVTKLWHGHGSLITSYALFVKKYIDGHSMQDTQGEKGDWQSKYSSQMYRRKEKNTFSCPMVLYIAHGYG